MGNAIIRHGTGKIGFGLQKGRLRVQHISHRAAAKIVFHTFDAQGLLSLRDGGADRLNARAG